MARREFLLLATPFDPEKHRVGGYYMSEKHDGARCWWDGGLTRGHRTFDIPWAGKLNPKTGQPKTDLTPISSGLWSRYGNPINAPDWFLNTLPACPLDGELWAGRGRFQDVMSFAKKKKPIDSEWAQLQFGVFGTPNFSTVMRDGEVKNANMVADIRWAEVERYIRTHCNTEGWMNLGGTKPVTFAEELATLVEWIDSSSETHFLIPQTKLPEDDDLAFQIALDRMKQVVAEKGEGLVLKAPGCTWEPKRRTDILKFKDINDTEGVITGFTSGRETTKGSKLLGLIGALVLEYDGKRLELSGLTNEERAFANQEMADYARRNPGADMPAEFNGRHFRVGDKVTFTYREFTNEGIPKEARYYRLRPQDA